MQAGRLRHKLTIERNVTSTSATGHPTASWQTLLTEWGSIDPVRGSERLAFAALASEVEFVVKIRYSTASAAVTAADRVVSDGRTYSIKAALPTNDRRWIDLLCASGVALA